MAIHDWTTVSSKTVEEKEIDLGEIEVDEEILREEEQRYEAPIRKKRRKKRIGTIIAIVIGVIAFLAGLFYALFPTIYGDYLNTQMAEAIGHVHVMRDDDMQSLDSDINRPLSLASMEYEDLYKALKAYNDKIYYENQSGLVDAWSYSEIAFDLTSYGIESGSIGYITIPKIDVEMPLYLGATYKHLAVGAAQLSQTSTPIGGVNTNCVIAGHNTWSGALYFHRLSEMELDDYIYITNLWETMAYKVVEVRTIDPKGVDQILIQPGKDMITLMTCWPTGSHGRYRLVVYAERAYDAPPLKSDEVEEPETGSILNLLHKTDAYSRWGGFLDKLFVSFTKLNNLIAPQE